ncbi:MAG: glycosyltransferase family 4 protein [Candidatus Goldbacteria bacterium]|nr:glycosyltransferase family 4 protein [Candidatus Goldiibacteriota bacterium]
MNILVISPVLPYPPNDGDRIRIYNFLKFLSRWNKIHLVSFIYKGEEKNVKFLEKFCSSVKIVYITKIQIFFNIFKTLFTSTPLNIGAYQSKKMKEIIEEEIRDKKIDLIYAYRIRSAPYALYHGIPTVIDIVDSLALVNKRRDIYERNIFRKIYIKVDYDRILNYEKNLYKNFKKIFINSEDDAKFLNTQNLYVISNGVTGRIIKKSKSDKFIIGFFGNIDYAPNYDAVVFFYKNIWKKITEFDKNIKLIIAGDKNRKLKNFDDENVEIKGYIDDIEHEICNWDVSLVPVRYGAGRQNKILKSWACGIPVVATPFAASGVYGKHGKNLLIAENSDDFIQAIYNIKNNKKMREKIIKGGFDTVKKYFNWQKNLNNLRNILRKVVNK